MDTRLIIALLSLDCICAFAIGFRRKFKLRNKKYYNALFKDCEKPYNWSHKLSRTRNHDCFNRVKILFGLLILTSIICVLCNLQTILKNYEIALFIFPLLIICIIIGEFFGAIRCDRLTKKECIKFGFVFPNLSKESSSNPWRFFIFLLRKL